MRALGHIPHPKLVITVFQMNEKFLVKFEAGGMEQVIKFSSEEVSGVEEIKRKLDTQFLNGIIERFNSLFVDLQRIKEKT